MKISHLLLALGLAIPALVTTGCASIFHGGPRTVSIDSTPSGASFYIRKIPMGQTEASPETKIEITGKTPATVSLSPKARYFVGQSYAVQFELAGYRTATVALKHTVSGWYFVNILLGGPLGMFVIDPATGAMWNLSPDKIEQTLTEEQVSMIKTGSGFVVQLLSDTTSNERANMIRVIE
jgi:hypothetical protein